MYSYYIKFLFIFIIISSTSLALLKEEDKNDTKSNSRKHYGISFDGGCGNYIAVFKCMTGCKSYGYKVYRMNLKCKCTCHDMKTSTILPFFKWRTNGTTRGLPKTRSPRLYDIVGTISPPPVEEITTVTTVDPCGGRWYSEPKANTGNGTDINTGNSTGGTTEPGVTSGDNGTEPTVEDNVPSMPTGNEAAATDAAGATEAAATATDGRAE